MKTIHLVKSEMTKSGDAATMACRECEVQTATTFEPAAWPERTPDGASSDETYFRKSSSEETRVSQLDENEMMSG